jgi:hypothetical protein
MSAKRTANAAMVVAEDALRRVRALESGEGLLTVTLALVLGLGYVYYINYMVGQGRAQEVMNMTSHPYLRIGIATVVMLGLSGMFGRALQVAATVVGFSFLAGHLFLHHAALARPMIGAAPKEGFSPYPIGISQPRCLPCTNGKNMFNPRPYRPDSPALGIGDPDRLPPSGVDFLSDPPGVYTQSGLAYEFNMA